MKSIPFILAIIAAMCVVSCKKVTVDATPEEPWTDDNPIIQFKDPEFLKALLVVEERVMEDGSTQVMDVDINKDGQISEKEASVAKTLFIDGSNVGDVISDIGEIKYFTALKYLLCHDTNSRTIDLSGNTTLQFLDCKYNSQLASLDVSGCTSLEWLECSDNKLASLDIGECTGLVYLLCQNNQLASLDVSECTGLVYLYCQNNQLASLDVSGCTGLTALWCDGNPLEKIILSTLHSGQSWEQEILSEYGDIITYEAPDFL